MLGNPKLLRLDAQSQLVLVEKFIEYFAYHTSDIRIRDERSGIYRGEIKAVDGQE